MAQLDEGSLIFLLPDHILEEKIFAHSGNLKNLSLTCKYFHDIVSKSRCLMKRFQLNINENSFDQHDISAILESPRKYSRIEFSQWKCRESSYKRIVSHKTLYCRKIIKHFRDSITEIHFVGCELNRSQLIDTFEMLVNLVELSFNSTEFLSSAFSQYPDPENLELQI